MTEATPNTTPATTAPKVKTVLEDMRSPMFFDSVEDAAAYLTKSQEEFSDFDKHDVLMNGIDDNGEFDADVYTDGTRVMVHVLKNRSKKTTDAKGVVTETPGSVRAIVISPVPSLDQIAADSQGAIWLNKIVNTQLAHQAVAGLRAADNLKVAAKDMPLALTDFVTTTRESSSISETFDKLFRGIIDAFKVKSPAWAKARLIKSELRKAMESSAYALAVYPTLEDRGDKPSLFVMALQLGIREAKAQGLDSTIFETWTTTRDDKALEDETLDGDEEDFDLDDLVIGTESEAAGEPTPVTDAETEQAEAATE